MEPTWSSKRREGNGVWHFGLLGAFGQLILRTLILRDWNPAMGLDDAVKGGLFPGRCE